MRMKKHEAGFSIIELLVIVIVVIVLAGMGYFVWHKTHLKSPKNTDNSSVLKTSSSLTGDLTSAKKVGTEAVADLQQSNTQAADKLAKTSFEELDNENGFGLSTLEYYQSGTPATSSNWTIKPAKNNTPETVTSTFTLVIGPTGESVNYDMTLQKITGQWLVTNFTGS